MKVGFIGLGATGSAMAKRVIGGGCELLIAVHRRREAADELTATPADIARQADAVITMAVFEIVSQRRLCTLTFPSRVAAFTRRAE